MDLTKFVSCAKLYRNGKCQSSCDLSVIIWAVCVWFPVTLGSRRNIAFKVMPSGIDAPLPTICQILDGFVHQFNWDGSHDAFGLILGMLHRVILDATHVFFQIRKQKKIARGQVWRVGGVSQPMEICKFHSCCASCVWPCIIMVKPQLSQVRNNRIRVPKSGSLLPDRIFQLVNDATVPLSIDCSVGKFCMNHTRVIHECCQKRFLHSSCTQCLLRSAALSQWHPVQRLTFEVRIILMQLCLIPCDDLVEENWVCSNPVEVLLADVNTGLSLDSWQDPWHKLAGYPSDFQFFFENAVHCALRESSVFHDLANGHPSVFVELSLHTIDSSPCDCSSGPSTVGLVSHRFQSVAFFEPLCPHAHLSFAHPFFTKDILEPPPNLDWGVSLCHKKLDHSPLVFLSLWHCQQIQQG